jgi:VWFA-related protein
MLMKVQKAAKWVTLAAIVLATTIVSGQKPAQNPNGTVFRATTNFVTTDVIVRDKDGKFVPDLRAGDFKVYEDGVLQKIALFRPLIGGRPNMANALLPTSVEPAPAASEGLITPPRRAATDTSGRIFIIFIDERHFTALETPKVRELLWEIRDNLIHDNDLVGFVSTGTTAVAVNPSYDYEHRRFDQVIDKIVGMAPKPDDYINEAFFEGQQGPIGLRQAASQAFATAYDMIQQLSAIVDRRKSFIYVSNGYTFDPFTDARFKRIQQQYEEYSFQDQQTEDPSSNQNADGSNVAKQSDLRPDNPLADPRYRERTMWKESELIAELAELTRDARRANVVFYTMDARGLITGMDAGQVNQIDYPDMRRFIDTQADSLKVLAEETGGFPTVGTNNFKAAIQRIDAETSDSYTIGYTSSNPDPFPIRRTIKIEVSRPGLTLIYRPDYTVMRPNRR